MASGFYDLFAYWLGWKSTPAVDRVAGPYYVDASQMYVANAEVGEVFSAGSRAGEIFAAEPQIGEVR